MFLYKGGGLVDDNRIKPWCHAQRLTAMVECEEDGVMRERILKVLVARLGGFTVSLLAGLIVPSMLFRHFPAETMGVWYLIAGTTMVAGLMQFGFPETLTRFAAYSTSKEGNSTNPIPGEEIPRDLPALVDVAFHATRFIAGMAFVATLLVSVIVLWPLHLPPDALRKALEAAGLVAVGTAIMARYRFWDSIIAGVGDAHWTIAITTINGLLYSCLQILVALVWPDIRGLACAFLLQAICGRVLFAVLAQNRYRELLGQRERTFDRGLFKKLMSLSLRQWAATLCAFIVLRTDQYFLAFFFTEKDVALYTVAFSLVAFMTTFASLGIAIANPFMSRLWADGKLDQVRRLVLIQTRCSVLLLLAGGLVVLSCGEGLFDVWLGKNKFIGYPVLALLIVMSVLELHHGIMVGFLYAINRVNLYAQAGLAAVLNVVFTLAFVKPFGVLGVPLGTFAAQLCASYWYGTYRALPELQLPFRTYLSKTLVPLGFFAGCLALVGWLGTRLTVDPVKQVVFTASVCAGIALPALWFWGLDSATRQWLTRIVTQRTLKWNNLDMPG